MLGFGKSFIVKQNISRIIKELEDKGMITSKTSKKDKRRERLELTSMGKQFVFESMMKVKGLSAEYKKLVGEADLAIAVKVINHIIDYHKGHNASVDENGVVD
jgi:DNA-binding MarR family transcriptional regulator